MPNIGPPCPECRKSTSYIGVEPSWFRNMWVEVYMCKEHTHRFEGPIKRNKHDKDYKTPPFEGGNAQFA